MPGRSQLSIDLSNAKQAYKRGCTIGAKPRQYNVEEMEAIRIKRDTLQEQQDEVQEARRAARVNSHTTVEIDRSIEATNKVTKETAKAVVNETKEVVQKAATATQVVVQESTRHAEAYFQAVGGAGSSNDLLVQGQGLIARAKQLKAVEKAESAAATKANKEAERLAEKKLKQDERERRPRRRKRLRESVRLQRRRRIKQSGLVM